MKIKYRLYYNILYKAELLRKQYFYNNVGDPHKHLFYCDITQKAYLILPSTKCKL